MNCFCKPVVFVSLLASPTSQASPDHVLVDIAGLLLCSTGGYRYLLTMMCATTRFPEAVPLRTILAKVVLREPLKFFSLFGLPKIVQTDHGSNFISHVFTHVLKQFCIQHNVSSAYHPESQGVLERYHQTLKSMLCAYCLESGKAWLDAVPWLPFAYREVTQELLGFSPADFVFAHTPQGPLALLKDQFLSDSPATDILSYLSDFHSHLHRAHDLARENLERAQGRMMVWYDRKAVVHHFKVGDQVLVIPSDLLCKLDILVHKR